MATTKIWPVKDSLARVVDYAQNPNKTIYSDLQKVLHYAANEEKTVEGKERAMFVTGVNCNRDTAFQEMQAVKERFGKTDGNVAYHAYQSFKPGEVTPELCHRLGVELAKQMWGDKYQVLVATHFNTGTYHNHFVVNSVGLWDGRKFNCGKRTYYQFRQLSDDLCKEYQLSTIKSPKGKTPRSIYFAEKSGEPTKYNLMREALDAALKVSVDGSDLRKALRDQGYELDANPAHKYATLRRIGSKKAVRLHRLGEGYDLPTLRERIEENRQRYAYDLGYQRYKPMPVQWSRPRRLRLKGSFSTVKKIGGFRGLYLHYCYRLGILPKGSNRRPLSPELREECRRLDAISRQAQLICREKLDTAEDVAGFISGKQAEIKVLGAARQKCYNRLRRCDNREEITQIKAQRDRLTAAMSVCRKDIKTAESVLSRSNRLKENLKLEQEMRTQRMGHAQDKRRERSAAR